MKKVTELINEINQDLTELRDNKEIENSVKLSRKVKLMRSIFAEVIYLLAKEAKNEKTDT